MIARIEAKNYRSLKYIDQKLSKFHVLVGPNASGKSTFMDVVTFMADIVKSGIDEAIQLRANSFTDLTFSGRGGNIELAIEVAIPARIKEKLDNRFDLIRYEISINLDEQLQEHGILEERVVLLNSEIIESGNAHDVVIQKELFPEVVEEPTSILNKKYHGGSGYSNQLVARKKPQGNDNFYDEMYKTSGKGWIPSFKLGSKRSTLANLPDDESKFPASSWLKSFLSNGVQHFILDSQKIRKASPPGQGFQFNTSGSNLPWVINSLQKNAGRFQQWVEHVRTALPDISTIETIERPDDKHRYLRVVYDNGISVPSWLVSDGTLRLLALTIPAYLPDFTGVFLIEEPENGIHPRAVETVMQSLSSVYNAQILLASHSPVILSLIAHKEVLCFAKTETGVTDIVRGSDHPELKHWSGETNLSVLYASGILG